MPLDVLVSPGCLGVADDFLDRARPDVIIDAGSIYAALTGSSEIPSTRPDVLRMALGLRTVAIRFARENNLDGLVRTGNADRAAIRRLQELAGPGAQVKVLQLPRQEACKRIESLVQGAYRRAACTAGLDRFYRRYQPDAGDEVVR